MTIPRSGPNRMTIAAAFSAVILAIGAPFGAFAQVADPLPGDPLPTEEAPADVEVFVFEVEADGAAETSVIINQTTTGNSVETSASDRSVSFTDNGNYVSGIFAINQDAGTANQQANVLVAAVDAPSAGEGGLIMQRGTSVIQELTGNSVIDGGGVESAIISGSFNGSEGLAQINQATGALNQQVNVASVALGAAFDYAPLLTLADTELSHVGTALEDNELTESEELIERGLLIENSLQGFEGVFQGHQTVGNLNRVTNSMSIGITGLGQ